jgi:hypothetical protein
MTTGEGEAQQAHLNETVDELLVRVLLLVLILLVQFERCEV